MKKNNNKKLISIRLDEDLINWYKKSSNIISGGRYQSMMNTVLKDYMNSVINKTKEN